MFVNFFIRRPVFSTVIATLDTVAAAPVRRSVSVMPSPQQAIRTRAGNGSVTVSPAPAFAEAVAPGTSTLSPGGMTLLDRMLPYLRRIRYPLLVAGHTANRRDEEGEKYAVDLNVDKVDSTWPLSLARAHAVYRHLATGGMPPERLSLEAFGQYRPRFPDRSPEGRLQNRRVDLVLDKRNAPEILQMEKDKTPLPRKVVITDKHVMGWPQYAAVFSDWNMAPKLPADLFAFKPGKELRRIALKPLAEGQAAQGGGHE